MKLYPDSKIYILCPGNVQTGGPESMHQLASVLSSFGLHVYMAYFPLNHSLFKKDSPVHDVYKKYHIPYVLEPEDRSQNIVIAPEANTWQLYIPKKIQRVIWWMSVDNYLKNIVDIFQYYIKNTLVGPMPNFFTFGTTDKNIEHWGQSEYVRQFLRLNGVTKIKTVETHMSQNFLSRSSLVDLTAKKNFVAFNPSKGFEITQYLMNIAPDIDWRPIENMTPAQVQKLLAEAKIYIDFGEFPGRERLPREAILSGCVVITGKRGAAANDVDVNIPAEFKFDMQAKPQDIIKKIRDVFDNFEREFDKQKDFREKELNAQKNFTAEVADAFGIKNLPSPTVALIQGVSEKNFLLAQELFKSKDFTPKFIVDDLLASTEIFDELILREQNRNYLRVGENFIEIITRDDAEFLYLEGRIKKFASLEPTIEELDAWKKFSADLLIFHS